MSHCPRIIVIEQAGCYFALGEDGRNFCAPDRNVDVLAGNLAEAVRDYVNGRKTQSSLKKSSRLEIYFKDRNGKVLFSVKKDHRSGKTSICLREEEPTQGQARIFYNAFLKSN